MKKTLLAFAAAAILSVACKKETTDDGGQTMTPSELIVGKWFGDESIGTVSVTGAGPLDTSYTETESTTWMRLTFNTDGTGQFDSLGMDVEPLTWVIQNNDLLVVDGTDTLMITKLNGTDLQLSQSEIDDDFAPVLIEYDQTLKFTK